jgi:hypothetical protein
MKYLLIAMMMSAPAFAGIDLFVDGEKQDIPDNRKLVIVPVHWDVDHIIYHAKTPVVDLPKDIPKCGELVISPGGVECVDE